jgi:hypothetical protein
MNHYAVHLFEGEKHAHLNYIYRGYLGQHNKPEYPHFSFIMQSMFKVIHFHFSLN